MKYLKLYEEFKFTEEEMVMEPEVELSDKTVDDVFKDDFFEKESENEDVYQDNTGVYHITNWKTY